MIRRPVPHKRCRTFMGFALAVALVHQLGACPCGCVEGNLWVQTLGRLFAANPPEMAAANSEQAPRSLQVAAANCDEAEPGVVYVASGGPQVNSLVAAMEGSVAMAPLECAAAWRAGTARLDDACVWARPPGRSARTLRAQFQIFLI